jgi:hypothetical protein
VPEHARFCWPAGTRDDRLVAVTEKGTGDAVPERERIDGRVGQ